MLRAIVFVVGSVALLVAAEADAGLAAEQRAIAYLSQEVPNWPRQNNCFSCHNNGDAARALYVARGLSHAVPAEALADTTAWLLRPLAWDDPKGDPGFSDLKLARIQFAAALTEGFQTGALTDRPALAAAAGRILQDQEPDGSWDVDVPGVVGSPATYGDTLGTYMARRTLAAAAEERFNSAIARADVWFLARSHGATMDVAAIAMALADRLGETARSSPSAETLAAVRKKLLEAVERILSTQSSDGGWGPYPKSPSEPFDTAVALLALHTAGDQQAGDSQAFKQTIARGRSYLIGGQLPAGGWPATTRPSGFQSYAQHISTSGWVALALMRTRNVAE
jgi:hypothetical protein